MSAAPLDLVVHGATGFVGRLTARHLAENAPDGVRIGLSGRSRGRLEEVRRGLGRAAVDWPLLTADAADRASLDALVGQTRAVVSTVGPYDRHGLPLVQACAAAGTSYGDLTGEVLFVRRSADTAHDDAVASGARVVHACGFDSVPSDLGVLLLAERALADGEGRLGETVFVLQAAKGGFSGGTIDSMRGQVDEMRRSADARKLILDAYSLSPDRESEPDRSGGGDGRDSFVPGRVDGRWVAPFVMAPFNTRVVRRTAALRGYGPDFRYREVMGVGGSPLAPVLAGAVAVGSGAAVVGLATPGVRQLLDRVLPDPGEGPSEKAQREGHFRVEVTTTTTTGARYRSTVAATGDPGYAATAVMLGQSGLCLALDDLPSGGGVLTPASAMGTALVDRLRAAGFTLEVERLG